MSERLVSSEADDPLHTFIDTTTHDAYDSIKKLRNIHIVFVLHDGLKISWRATQLRLKVVEAEILNYSSRLRLQATLS